MVGKIIDYQTYHSLILGARECIPLHGKKGALQKWLRISMKCEFSGVFWWVQSNLNVQYTGLENSMDYIVHGVRKSWTRLSDFLEKAMAPHSSTLAWKIPWMEEPGRLQSMGLLRVRHDWTTSLSLFTFMHWRRKWQPTPVFLPGESQGQGSLVGCHLWDRTKSDMTEVT